MAVLVLGIVTFVGVHLVPSVPALRDGIVGRVGFNRYRGLFSLLAAAGLVLIIVGKAYAPTVPLWNPPSWGFRVSVIGMPIAFILLAAAYLPTNIKRVVKHPMLSAVAVWAGLHLLSNGDLASLILFGGLGAFSLFDIVSANLRGTALPARGVAWWRDVVPVIGGVVVYFLFLHYHQALFGRAVLPYWKALWT